MPRLPDLPLKAFLVQVKVKPGEHWELDGRQVEGFYRQFGVTVRDAIEMEALIRDNLREEDALLVEIGDVWVPDFAGDDAALADVVADLGVPGIWYRSGCAFFGKE